MIRILPRFAAALVLTGAALLVTACAPAAPEAPPETTPTSAPEQSQAPEPAATPSEEPAAVADPTCETIISATTADDFASLGWTSLSDPFRVGTVEIPEGVQCVWGDFSTASDYVQIFGWAPITPEQAATATDQLVAEGWRREESPEGVYVTENTDAGATTDDQGYGLTYLFGDGWVKYADTKQGLVLVEWPPS